MGNPNWPGLRTLHVLVKRAGGLFIWAATAYRYISRGKAFANERLQAVLAGVNEASSPTQSLDSIYLTVLDNVASDYHRAEEQSELTSALYDVLKTIAIMAAPVDRRSLAHLAETSCDSANKALVGLHSIIAIPDDISKPMRLHHASFREFIMDPSRCNDPRFSVDGKWQHKILAERCVRLMAERLRQDICHLRAPDVHISQLDRSVVKQWLSPSVEYACRYWLHHAQQADEMFDDLSGISRFLHKHLLHWLEALSLLRRPLEAIHVLGSLELLTVSRLSGYRGQC
jgi:hypothetical protein